MRIIINTRKRKRNHSFENEWDSGQESAAVDPIEDDNDELEDELDDEPRSSRRATSHSTRALRSRESTKRLSRTPSVMFGNDELDEFEQGLSVAPTRSLRARQPRQQTLISMHAKSNMSSQDQDELIDEPPPALSDEEDHDFIPVVLSDIAPKKGRPSKRRLMSKRQQQLKNARSRPQTMSRHKSADSDIEFEDNPRRSSRATRNVHSMLDVALMDDDSFYVVDEKGPGASKVAAVRENFVSLPLASAFPSMHMSTCHTCGQSRQRGQLVHCQGCTLSYHKTSQCMGFRSARDHMATKVGDDSFVLQCKFCIGHYRKKDPKAPKHSMCQGCKGEGRACAAFSEKKTARQEEKLREQNDGVDPITSVSPKLLNNSDLLLFRCVTCHRGWHIDHLPGSGALPGKETIGTDLVSERFKDHTVDWQCQECGIVKNKMHRLVAWRPVDREVAKQIPKPTSNDISEDDKEYLIKWENCSYFYCTWKPSAWVYGYGSSAMRNAFGKRDVEQDLLKLEEKDAIPDEFLMADVILNVKMDASAPRAKTKEEELANIAHVSRVYVKFQGLAYDDVVWDPPPSSELGDIYNAFVEAFYEYVEGKYFKTESQTRICERVRAFKTEPFEEVVEQPAGLKRGKLMGYQLEGVNWLLGNYHSGRSVVLADEMGLGKTVQVVGLVTSLIQDSPKVHTYYYTLRNASLC